MLPWRRQESSTSSTDSPPHRQANWVQSISRRSLHRARSGLLALRAGVRRHSTVDDDFEADIGLRSFVNPVALRRERQRQHGSSEAYTSSTQEDLEFGFEMHRMSGPSSLQSDTPRGTSAPSAVEALANGALESSGTHSSVSHKGRSPLASSAVISEYDGMAVSAQTHGHTLSMLSGEQKANTGRLQTDVRTSRASSGSINQHNLGSPSRLSSPAPRIHIGPEISRGSSKEEQAKEASQPMCSIADADPKSQVSLESDAKHVLNQDQRRESEDRSSPALPDETASKDADEISQTSAECLFAFPGIYQEILNQWASAPGEDMPDIPQADEQPGCVALEGGQSSNPPPHQESEDSTRRDQAFDATSLDSSDSCHADRGSDLDLEDARSSRIHVLLSSEVEAQCPEERASSARSTTYEPLLDAAHFPGANVPLLPVRQRQDHRSSYGTFSSVPRDHLGQRHSFAPRRPCNFGYPSNECDNPLFSPENSTSPEYTSTEVTSRTSMSSNPWSPTDSDVYFGSPTIDRNEFFLVDGKTSSQYPYWGDHTVKSVYPTWNEEDMNDHMARARNNPDQVHRVILPPRPFTEGHVGNQADFEDDFTDDEFYPGSWMPPT
ncbi:unnamed protein product [Penicillium olsonii]|nr:unnamed protein product [Penicillium olsonii]